MIDNVTYLNSCEAILSSHAATRAAQRNVPGELISLILTFGDIELPAAGRRRRLRLSRSRAAELAADGYSVRLLDALQRIELILGTMDRVVTVIRCDPNPTRRDMPFPQHRHPARI